MRRFVVLFFAVLFTVSSIQVTGCGSKREESPLFKGESSLDPDAAMKEMQEGQAREAKPSAQKK